MIIKGLWVCGGSDGTAGGVLIQPYRGAIVPGGVLLSGVYLRFTDRWGKMKLRNRRVYLRDRGTGEGDDPQGTNWFREVGDFEGIRELAWEVIQLVDDPPDHRKIDRLATAIVGLVRI